MRNKNRTLKAGEVLKMEKKDGLVLSLRLQFSILLFSKHLSHLNG